MGKKVLHYHKMHWLMDGEKYPKQSLAYWVQLANFRQENLNLVSGDGWARVSEAQMQAGYSGTGMAVTDIGGLMTFTKNNKRCKDLQRSHQTLQQKNSIRPTLQESQSWGKSIRISFNHTGSGLMVENRPAPPELKNESSNIFLFQG